MSRDKLTNIHPAVGYIACHGYPIAGLFFREVVIMSYVFMIHSGYCGIGGSRYITDFKEYQSEDDAFEAGQEAYSVVCQRWIASEGIPRPSDDAGDDDPWYVAYDDLMSDDCNGFTVFPLYGTEGVDEFSGRGYELYNACYLETDDLAIA
jgi:hypothetical protein